MRTGSATSRVASATSRDLPAPATPRSATTSRASIAARSRASSLSRPTKARPSNVRPGVASRLRVRGPPWVPDIGFPSSACRSRADSVEGSTPSSSRNRSRRRSSAASAPARSPAAASACACTTATDSRSGSAVAASAAYPAAVAASPTASAARAAVSSTSTRARSRRSRGAASPLGVRVLRERFTPQPERGGAVTTRVRRTALAQRLPRLLGQDEELGDVDGARSERVAGRDRSPRPRARPGPGGHA